MATDSVKLVLTFKTDEDKNAQYSFKYAKKTATAAQVKNLMNTMIANTSTYENTLVSAEKAEIVETSVTYFDLTTDSMTEGVLSDEEALARGVIDAEGNYVPLETRALLNTKSTTTRIR